MAVKKVREAAAKRLLKLYGGKFFASLRPATVTGLDFAAGMDREFPSGDGARLVVKPDCLFGKRGKHDLVGLDLSVEEAKAFIQARSGKRVEVDGCAGVVDTFIVEPFVPHADEFYMSIASERLGLTVSFSDMGGIEIEENWDRVKSVFLPTGEAPSEERLGSLFTQVAVDLRPKLLDYVCACLAAFDDLDFSFMEMNPFTIDPATQQPFPLDMRGALDDTAAYRQQRRWGDAAVDFPMPFGRRLSPAERTVSAMDERTGASLKLTILNPRGSIWTMVAGGGASVIYADTVGDLGCASMLGNYAEYSGAPNAEETYAFSKTLIQCATWKEKKDGKEKEEKEERRAIIVGGGIANFTNVATTFDGIIRAMREAQEAMRGAGVRVYVRRGGPNYQQGLARMRTLGEEIGIPFVVAGPEASMTGVCKEAIAYVTGNAPR